MHRQTRAGKRAKRVRLGVTRYGVAHANSHMMSKLNVGTQGCDDARLRLSEGLYLSTQCRTVCARMLGAPLHRVELPGVPLYWVELPPHMLLDVLDVGELRKLTCRTPMTRRGRGRAGSPGTHR